jgi:hypothetical protein
VRVVRRAVLVALILTRCATAPAHTPWADARAAFVAARAAGDAPASRRALGQLFEMSGSTAALRALARLDVRLGERERAIADLEGLAELGSGLDLDAASDLSPLKDDHRLDRARVRLAANRAPVARAHPFAELPKQDLLTEDLAYDPATKTFFVSSIRRKKILAVAADGAVRDFVPPGSESFVALGVHAGRLWATTAQLPPMQGYDARAPKKTALVAFDLVSARQVERIELSLDDEKEHALTDLSASGAGVFVSDALGGNVYALEGGALVPLAREGSFASPQTPAPSPDGHRLFVPDYGRGVAVVDRATRTVSWLGRGEGVALDGIDGLYAVDGGLLAVQNGIDPARVVRLWFGPGESAIERVEVLERATPGLGDPTHGVVDGGRFCFLAGSGWSRFDEAGHLLPDAGPDAPAIWALALELSSGKR